MDLHAGDYEHSGIPHPDGTKRTTPRVTPHDDDTRRQSIRNETDRVRAQAKVNRDRLVTVISVSNKTPIAPTLVRKETYPPGASGIMDEKYTSLRRNLLHGLLLSGAHSKKAPPKTVTNAWRSLTSQMFDEDNSRHGTAPLAMYKNGRKILTLY